MTIWQHVSFEDEAAIGIWAKSRGILYKVVKCWENEELEADDLLIVLGGSMSAYSNIDFINKEIEFLSERINNNKKTFGICLGAQLIAKAMGASVYNSNTQEAGWHNIEILPHPLTFDIKQNQTVFQWHNDTFELPPETLRLASNSAFKNQAFSSKDCKVIATQFHLEATKESINNLLKINKEYLNFNSPFVSTEKDIIAKIDNDLESNNLLFNLLDKWIKL